MKTFYGTNNVNFFYGTNKTIVDIGISDEYFTIDNGVISIKSNVTLPEILIIPEKVNGETVTGYAEQMLKYNKNDTINNIKCVVLLPSITVIPAQFCAKAIGLTGLVNTEQITEIGASAFYTTSLQTINFPNLMTVGKSAFENCTNATNANVGEITSIPEGLFEGCSKLTEITGLSNVTTVGVGAFIKTYSLQNTDLNASNLTYIDRQAFRDTALRFTWTNPSRYAQLATDANMNYESGYDAYKTGSSSAYSNTLNMYINQMNYLWAERVVGNIDYSQDPILQEYQGYTIEPFVYKMACIFLSMMFAYLSMRHAVNSYYTPDDLEQQLKKDGGDNVFSDWLTYDGQNRYTVDEINHKLSVNPYAFIKFIAGKLGIENLLDFTHKNANNSDFAALASHLSNGGYAILLIPTSANTTRSHAVCAYGIDSNYKLKIRNGLMDFQLGNPSVLDYFIPIENEIAQNNLLWNGTQYIQNTAYGNDDCSFILISKE